MSISLPAATCCRDLSTAKGSNATVESSRSLLPDKLSWISSQPCRLQLTEVLTDPDPFVDTQLVKKGPAEDSGGVQIVKLDSYGVRTNALDTDYANVLSSSDLDRDMRTSATQRLATSQRTLVECQERLAHHGLSLSLASTICGRAFNSEKLRGITEGTAVAKGNLQLLYSKSAPGDDS